MGVTIDSRYLSKRCEASWHLSNMLVRRLSIAPQSPSSLSAATCSFCVSDPIVRVGTTTAVYLLLRLPLHQCRGFLRWPEPTPQVQVPGCPWGAWLVM